LIDSDNAGWLTKRSRLALLILPASTIFLEPRPNNFFFVMARTDDVIPFFVELRVLYLDFGQVGPGYLDAGGVDVGVELATYLQPRGSGGVSD
jgi:hypothetical protein